VVPFVRHPGDLRLARRPVAARRFAASSVESALARLRRQNLVVAGP
jgi:hypothetical protein